MEGRQQHLWKEALRVLNGADAASPSAGMLGGGEGGVAGHRTSRQDGSEPGGGCFCTWWYTSCALPRNLTTRGPDAGTPLLYIAKGAWALPGTPPS